MPATLLIVELTVWLDGWQMECCGEPFRVGGEVSWTLRGPDSELLDTIFGVGAVTADAAEEHHGGLPDDAPATTGTVRWIDAVYCRYAPIPGQPANYRFPTAGSGARLHLRAAIGRPPDHGDLEFCGYLVGLDHVDGVLPRAGGTVRTG